MPIINELIASVVGGVLTAAILALFSRPGKPRADVSRAAPAAVRPRGRGFFGELFRVLLAVTGGIAIALVGGRLLIQSEALPSGLPRSAGCGGSGVLDAVLGRTTVASTLPRRGHRRDNAVIAFPRTLAAAIVAAVERGSGTSWRKRALSWSGLASSAPRSPTT
jgi:hypothetical protein